MKTGTYVYNDELYNFNFYTNISIANKLKFVNSVVDLVVTENRYNSVIRDLIFDFYVIDILTDIDTVDLKQSAIFLNDVEQFLEETNIVEIVRANASPALFDELNDAVDKSIQYLTGIHPSPIADSIASLFSALEKKVIEVDLDSMMSMAQKFAGMTGELTPESIMNAYMNSDVHKKNLEEIVGVKKDNKRKKNEVMIGEGLGEAVRTIAKENKDEKSDS